MRSIINVIKAAFRASLSGPGLLGWLVALVKPIAKALNMASDIDLLANYFGAAGKFLETGWGTLTSVVLGAVIIGYAVYRNTRRAEKDESHRISILELLSKATVKGWVFDRDTLHARQGWVHNENRYVSTSVPSGRNEPNLYSNLHVERETALAWLDSIKRMTPRQRLARMRKSFERNKSVLTEDYKYFITPDKPAKKQKRTARAEISKCQQTR
jgi:hypothetical protein